jgi:hypothetical protein
LTSYCIQYLAEREAEPAGVIVGSLFIHESPLADAEHRAAELSVEFGNARAFRILDMGGGIHAFRVLDDRAGSAVPAPSQERTVP